MLFFSAILLCLVQLAFLSHNPNDPCFYGLTYCLNHDGSTRCSADTVAAVTFRAGHDDEAEHLSMSLLAYHSKGPEPITLSLGFNVKGKPYNFYCSSDGNKIDKPTGIDTIWANYDFRCNWKLDVTANSNHIAPVTNSSISIDLATIDDNVPITLGFNDIKAVVAPNLQETLIHQLSFLDCWQENQESFYDSEKQNRVMLMKKESERQMETFIYGLVPDTKSTNRSVKFVNGNGVSLTVSCDKSFSTLTGFVQKGDMKESIDKLFTFKSLDGYRCGFKLPFIVRTANIKFNFDSRPFDFSFSSVASISKPNLRFDTDERNWPTEIFKIDSTNGKENLPSDIHDSQDRKPLDHPDKDSDDYCWLC